MTVDELIEQLKVNPSDELIGRMVDSNDLSPTAASSLRLQWIEGYQDFYLVRKSS